MVAIIPVAQIAPTPQPLALRYGLFNAATVTEDLNAREIASGFQIATPDCGTVRLYDAQCLPSENPAKTLDESLDYLTADPFWVYASRECGPIGSPTPEFMDSVRRRLIGGEQTQVEAALWGGTVPSVDPNLIGHVGTVTVTPAAPGAGAAIAALEESFYSVYGYVGTIHVNQQAYAAAAYSQIVERRNAQLVTPLGSTWSFGAGYGITGPAGVAPAAGFVWAFMTPYVWIRRSEVISRVAPSEILNRTTNQLTGIAERVYAATWTCDVVHAVQVPVAAPAVATAPAVP